jgi:cell division protein FtsZ
MELFDQINRKAIQQENKMSKIMADLPELGTHAKIVVFGVGGGGGNAVNNMISKRDLMGVRFIAANTDIQALESSMADHRLQIGARLTSGLGAGADPEVGKNAAMEDQQKLAEMLGTADMVFVTAGMGGGTGTGAAPIIARAAKDAGALTVGVVTKPFMIEGVRRARNAENGIAELEKCVDSLIVIPNDRLLEHAAGSATLTEAFTMADDVLFHAVKSISSLVIEPGLINLDFADVRRVMHQKGRAVMGQGEASGEGRSIEAAQNAITSHLLEESSIEGAQGILVNIIGGPDLKLHELNEAVGLIQASAHDSAEIIMGAVVRDDMHDKIRITVIATGFDRAYDPASAEEFMAQAAMRQESAAPRHWQQTTPPPVPQHQERAPIWSNQQAQVQAQARRSPTQPPRREPIIHNPWDEGAVTKEMEQPAFIRRKTEN